MWPARLKTFILLALLTAVLLFVGQLIGGYSGLIFAGVFVIGMNIFSLYFSDKLVLKMYKAQPAPKDSRLYKSVVRLSKRAELPMPKVYTLQQAQPNAFATGRSPKHAAVAATQGLLDLLDDDELDGVVAHELAHIKHYDTLLQTIAATIAGIISYVATMAQWAAIFGGLGGRDNNGDNNIVGLLVLIIVTPFVATLLQLALSRQREYMADERAAKITHKPGALASALHKISAGSRAPMRGGNDATASLFIVNPFTRSALAGLFSTHPPMEKRIERLKAMR